MKISVLRLEERIQQEDECCLGRADSAEKWTSDRTESMKVGRALLRRAAYRFLLREIMTAFPGLEKEYGGCRLLTDRGPAGSGDELSVIPFMKDVLGKPYLPGHPEILFNLSHSRNGYAAVVVSDSAEASAVGIDIEARFPYRELLARKICSESENRLLLEASSADEKKRLLNLFWSRKEAILKCKGTGIRQDLRLVDTLRFSRNCELHEEMNEAYTLVTCVKIIRKTGEEGKRPDLS